jgi:hypothetical protein
LLPQLLIGVPLTGTKAPERHARHSMGDDSLRVSSAAASSVLDDLMKQLRKGSQNETFLHLPPLPVIGFCCDVTMIVQSYWQIRKNACDFVPGPGAGPKPRPQTLTVSQYNRLFSIYKIISK